MSQIFQNEFSTRVQIWLEVDDLRLSVAQVGEELLILRDAATLSPDESARVRLSINGEERLFPIRLRGQEGRKVRFTHCDHAESGRCSDSTPF